MRLLVVFAFLFTSVLAAAGQTPKASPPPQPRATPSSAPQNLPATVRTMQPVDPRRFQSNFPLNPVSESNMLAARVLYLQRFITPLYRKPSAKELDAVAPDPRLLEKYGDILRLPNTGIFRLVSDSGCATNAKVLNAKEECIKYSMPGAGNSFSFRTENYRIRHLADITYDGDELQITGVFMHGVMTKLGDRPLESVAMTAPGMKFITEFKPSTSAADVAEIDAAFRGGLVVGGYKYAMALPAEPDTTYAYRGVAYRGKVIRSVNGVRYNELDYDKREDVTVAFRILEKSEDKCITIIWRLLVESESPKLKIPTPDSNNESDNLTGGN